MKAWILKKYGTPDALELTDLETPMPNKGEVLVKVEAAAINDYDWSMVRGKPYLYRLMFGLFRPKRAVIGMELAGRVEAVGTEVKAFKPGDPVYGDISEYGFGAFAEYLAVDHRALIKKPPHLSFEAAASLPHAALLASQGMIDIGEIKANEQVLINGAGGGVGFFGLQIAKQFNACVTGVDTGTKLEAMQSAGFDRVIDYKSEDFTLSDQQYDLILDAKTTRSPSHYRRVLKPQGRYVTVGGDLNQLLQLFIMKRWISKPNKQRFAILALKPNQGLGYIEKLCEEGKISPTIDGPYEFERLPELISYFGAGNHTGKVVIKGPA